MIKIVNDKITPALAHVVTNTKTNKNGDPYAVHQIFPLGEDKTVDYAKTPKKISPICAAYTNADTAFDKIDAVTIHTIETVYPNQNSSLFCKINEAADTETDISAPVLIIPIPYRGSLTEVQVPNACVKKALIVSTTPFKYMEQKCEFNRILYLVACVPDPELVISFNTTAIHRDENNETAEVYTRKHQAVIKKNDDGDYIIESLEITSQEREKKNIDEIDNSKKSIADIVDIAVNDIQKADNKPKYTGNKKPYTKKNDNDDKKNYREIADRKSSDNNTEASRFCKDDNSRVFYKDHKDSGFKLDFTTMDKEARQKKANRRLNKSKSRYDY